jgi:uncharacterized membrane protein
MYPKSRIDALTDGIFAVAMTILVLDVRLPDEFRPSDAAALARALRQLWPKVFPYILSFYVLGNSWLSMIRLRSHGEFVDRRYAVWWLLQLLLATCLPFSTTVVGRFAELAPSVWLYAANMAALSAVGYRLVVLSPDLESGEQASDRKISLLVLIGTSVACIGLTAISPPRALWVYVLNVASPPLARWIGKRRSARGA